MILSCKSTLQTDIQNYPNTDYNSYMRGVAYQRK
jgi:hypothetical protein